MEVGPLSWQASFNFTDNGDLGATLQQAAVLFNFSLHHAVMVLREHERRDAVFDSTTEGALIAAYAVVVATGVASNLLVAGVILSRSRVRTPRNVFLLNLNASDLVLCLVCVPFTLLELLRRHWPLGGALCRLLPFLQCASIFASSASVAIIAIDRQRCVLSTSAERRVQSGGNRRDTSRKYRLCRWRKGRRVFRQTLIVWTTACLLSLPNCFSRHAQVAHLSGLAVYTRCVERWPHRYGKQAYTLLVLLAQFLIPVAVLTVAHLRIKAHLGLTSVSNVKTGSSTSVQSNADRLRKELARNRRATFILFSVSAVYAISWLPWNALNLAADLAPTLLSPRRLYLSFGVCHLVAMTSATTNPFLYGWLNTNIKKELLEVGERVLSSHRSTLTDTNNQQQQETLSDANTRRIKSADPSFVTQDSDSNREAHYYQRNNEGPADRAEKADKDTPLRKFYSLKISKRDKNLKKLRSFSMEYRGLREQHKLRKMSDSSTHQSHSLISRETESTSSFKGSVSTPSKDLRRFLTEIQRRESTGSDRVIVDELSHLSRESLKVSNGSRESLKISNGSRESLKISNGSPESLKISNGSRESIFSAINNENDKIISSTSTLTSDKIIDTSIFIDDEKDRLVSRSRYDIVSSYRTLSPSLNVELGLRPTGGSDVVDSNDSAFKTLSLENLELGFGLNLFPKLNHQRHLVIHCHPRDRDLPSISSRKNKEKHLTKIPSSSRVDKKEAQDERENPDLNGIEVMAKGAFLIEQKIDDDKNRINSLNLLNGDEKFHLLRVFSVRGPKERSKQSTGLSVEANF